MNYGLHPQYHHIYTPPQQQEEKGGVLEYLVGLEGISVMTNQGVNSMAIMVPGEHVETPKIDGERILCFF